MNRKCTRLTKSSTASLIPVAAKTQTRGTAVASGLNAVILGMDWDGLRLIMLSSILINNKLNS